MTQKKNMLRTVSDRPAVMADVAKLVGVSYQTVSRVIHDSPNVRSDTRERVLEAIQQLDYRPNTMARALVTGRSRTLGVISFDTSLYGPASTLVGIERAAHETGYAISIASLQSIDKASVLGAMERLRCQGTEGIIFLAPQKTAINALLHFPPRVPYVAVEAGPDDSVPLVAVDQFAGAFVATQHLLDLGHKCIWHIAGPADFLSSAPRIAGWKAALKKAGVRPPAILRGDWSARSGYEAGQQLKEIQEITAVFIANDQMALGFLRVMNEMGLESPRDISIVGFDDIPEAAYFSPPLTTVRQDFMKVGRCCLNMLVQQIESGKQPLSHKVAPELIVRHSTSAFKK